MKNDAAGRGIPSQVFLGLAVIGLGLLFLLDNLGLIEMRRAWHYWPVLLIAVGGIKLLEARSPQQRLVFGLMALAGVILMLNRMGFYFFNLRTLWPVLLIVLGGLVVYKAVSGRRMVTRSLKSGEHNDSVVDITAILGGFERRVVTQDFRGGEVTAIMGGCELDLRGSSIQGEALLNVFAAMGGIELKCPPDWTIILKGTPIMGGFEEKTATPPDNSKRLIIRGYAIMGGVEIRN